MKRQKSISQIKEQNKIIARELNETEISIMLDGEFQVMIVKKLTRLENSVEDQ